jgi:hypothetical protein
MTIYRNFNVVFTFYIESITLILGIMLINQGGELLTILYKVSPYLFLVLMKLEEKCLKPVNSLHALECLDSKRC